MSTATSSAFASPGGRAEFCLMSFGRIMDAVGRVIRERMRRMRPSRPPLDRERIAHRRAAARARNARPAHAERTRMLLGRLVY